MLKQPTEMVVTISRMKWKKTRKMVTRLKSKSQMTMRTMTTMLRRLKIRLLEFKASHNSPQCLNTKLTQYKRKN